MEAINRVKRIVGQFLENNQMKPPPFILNERRYYDFIDLQLLENLFDALHLQINA